MEKKLISLVLIVLIGGLGGGYGLNYVIYQPQIQNLHDDINALNDRFGTINTTLGSTQTSVTSLEDELNMLNSDIANLNSTVESSVTSIHDEMNILDSDLTSLNSTLEMIENRTWHEVYSVSASSDMTSGIFQLKGREFKISWYGISAYTDGWLEINLYFSNGTMDSYWGSSGVWTAMDAELWLVEVGDYYLEILTYQTDYWVSVLDYY